MRTVTVVLGLGLAALCGHMTADWMIAPRGTMGPTLLQAANAVSSVFAMLVLLASLTGIGALVGRNSTAASGLGVVGFGLAALSLRLEGMSGLAMAGGSITMLSVEAIGLGVFLLAASGVIFAVSGPLQNVPSPPPGDPTPLSLQGLGRALRVSLVVIVVAWVVAASASKGQALGAALAGGVAVGLLARRFEPTLQPVALFAMPTAVAAIGYGIGAVTLGGPLDVAFVEQSISPLLFVMPIDYAAGSMIGVATGLSWGAAWAQPPEDASAPAT